MITGILRMDKMWNTVIKDITNVEETLYQTIEWGQQIMYGHMQRTNNKVDTNRKEKEREIPSNMGRMQPRNCKW